MAAESRGCFTIVRPQAAERNYQHSGGMRARHFPREQSDSMPPSPHYPYQSAQALDGGSQVA